MPSTRESQCRLVTSGAPSEICLPEVIFARISQSVTQQLRGFGKPIGAATTTHPRAPSESNMTFPATTSARVAAASPRRLSASREARRRRVTASAGADAEVPRKAPSRRGSVPERWHTARPGDRIALTTMPSSRPTLGVSSWPDFDYDASGATTLGVVEPPDPKHPDALRLRFDVRTFEGPPVCGRTTRVFGVPLPPGVRIDITPLSLHGWLDPKTGACALDFDAEFRGSIFGEGFIKLPPMTVRSPLTTGAARGASREAFGKPFGSTRARGDDAYSYDVEDDVEDVTHRLLLKKNSPCRGGADGDLAELVAVATVPRVSGRWSGLMNFMLSLPNDALAVLPCRLRVWDAAEPGVLEESQGNKEEADILRRLDSRFEYRARVADPLPISRTEVNLALVTFGAATFVEESHQLYA
jgi:hypothetical protein